MPKTVLITGATGGIGQAIAQAFSDAGFQLALHYRSQENQAKALKADLQKKTTAVEIFQADLADYDATQELIKSVYETFGQLDIVVNNAGMTRDQLFLRMKEADFQSVMQTNLGSVFNVSKGVIRAFIKQGHGKIINISSVVATTGNPGQVNYVASKAAIEGLTRSLAKEVGKKNITVNAVAPGFIQTAMTAALSPELTANYLAQIPLNRLGEPNEVAYLVRFLASDEANYITGQTIHVNGGMI